MSDQLLVFCVALLGAAAGSLLARGLAWRCGAVSAPNPIVSQHTTATPCLGGAGVFCGLVAAWTAGPMPPACVVIPAGLYCIFGVLDDLRPFRVAGKLVGQTTIAVIAVALGLQLRLTNIALVDQAMTVLWIVTLVNAVNVTDVCDGLVGGLGAVFFLCWAMLSPVLPLVGWAAFAACLGFLPLNVPKASLFLGDSGSHLIGFLMGALLVFLPPAPGALHLAQLVLAALVPLFELVFITAVRLRKGLPWWKGSPDHFSLRLQEAGWDRMTVDVVAWSVVALGATAGLVLAGMTARGVIAVLLGTALLCVTATRFLLRHEVGSAKQRPLAD